jgi:hypothetical protein
MEEEEKSINRKVEEVEEVLGWLGVIHSCGSWFLY